MMTHYQVLKIIATILSYESDTITLKSILSKPSFDWESVIKIGSRHYMLPAIYIRLKQKSLLSVLPSELIDYLEELTNINRNRNQSLLKEVHVINELFQSHDISHVFLKGIALLAGDYYKDTGERMIADIDILVDANDIDKAFQLLLDNNFNAAQETTLHQYVEHRHLARLIPKDGLAAVEIHWRLFNSNKIKELQPDLVLESKQLINSVFIPSNKHLLQHSVLNWQINNDGNYFSKIGLRNAYDSLTIQHSHPEISILEELKNSYSKNYYRLLSLFFEDIDSEIFSKNSFKLSFLRFKYKHQKLSHIFDRILNKLLYLQILLNRFSLFLRNKKYRKDVIADQQRILKLLKKFKI